MENNHKKLKFYILFLIDEFEKKAQRSYQTSMQTVLRGSSGPVADLFKDTHAYGKFPQLKTFELEAAIDELLLETVIVGVENERRRRHYYKKISNEFKNQRMLLDQTFDLETGVIVEYNNEIHYYETARDVSESTAISNKGTVIIETIYNKEVVVQYESELEKRFLNDLDLFDYIKNVIDQPKLTFDDDVNIGINYTPDFLIQTYHNHLIMIEIKELSEITRKSVIVKYQRLKEYNFLKNIKTELVALYEDKWITFEMIKELNVNEDFEKFILNTIAIKGEFVYDDLKKAEKEIKFNELDIHKIIIKNNLKRTGMYNNFKIV